MKYGGVVCWGSPAWDIVDLYNRTPIGAEVIVFGTGNPAAAGQ
jgi:hypothetical protein